MASGEAGIAGYGAGNVAPSREQRMTQKDRAQQHGDFASLGSRQCSLSDPRAGSTRKKASTVPLSFLSLAEESLGTPENQRFTNRSLPKRATSSTLKSAQQSREQPTMRSAVPAPSRNSMRVPRTTGHGCDGGFSGRPGGGLDEAGRPNADGEKAMWHRADGSSALCSSPRNEARAAAGRKAFSVQPENSGRQREAGEGSGSSKSRLAPAASRRSALRVSPERQWERSSRPNARKSGSLGAGRDAPRNTRLGSKSLPSGRNREERPRLTSPRVAPSRKPPTRSGVIRRPQRPDTCGIMASLLSASPSATVCSLDTASTQPTIGPETRGATELPDSKLPRQSNRSHVETAPGLAAVSDSLNIVAADYQPPIPETLPNVGAPADSLQFVRTQNGRVQIRRNLSKPCPPPQWSASTPSKIDSVLIPASSPPNSVPMPRNSPPHPQRPPKAFADPVLKAVTRIFVKNSVVATAEKKHKDNASINQNTTQQRNSACEGNQNTRTVNRLEDNNVDVHNEHAGDHGDLATSHKSKLAAKPCLRYVTEAEDGRAGQDASSSNDNTSYLAQIVPVFTLHENPQILLFTQMIAADECAHIVSLCEDRWLPSKTSVGGEKANESSYVTDRSRNRTSENVRLRPGCSAMISALEHRLASMVGLPLSHLEALMVVRYHPGQFFNTHHDGAFRPITVLLYIQDPLEGGATEFSSLGLRIQPRKGDAAYWLNTTGSKKMDMRTVHAGLPVRRGTKIVVNCFFNESAVRLDPSYMAAVEDEIARQDDVFNRNRACDPQAATPPIVAAGGSVLPALQAGLGWDRQRVESDEPPPSRPAAPLPLTPPSFQQPDMPVSTFMQPSIVKPEPTAGPVIPGALRAQQHFATTGHYALTSQTQQHWGAPKAADPRRLMHRSHAHPPGAPSLDYVPTPPGASPKRLQFPSVTRIFPSHHAYSIPPTAPPQVLPGGAGRSALAPPQDRDIRRAATALIEKKYRLRAPTAAAVVRDTHKQRHANPSRLETAAVEPHGTRSLNTVDRRFRARTPIPSTLSRCLSAPPASPHSSTKPIIENAHRLESLPNVAAPIVAPQENLNSLSVPMPPPSEDPISPSVAMIPPTPNCSVNVSDTPEMPVAPSASCYFGGFDIAAAAATARAKAGESPVMAGPLGGPTPFNNGFMATDLAELMQNGQVPLGASTASMPGIPAAYVMGTDVFGLPQLMPLSSTDAIPANVLGGNHAINPILLTAMKKYGLVAQDHQPGAQPAVGFPMPTLGRRSGVSSNPAPQTLYTLEENCSAVPILRSSSKTDNPTSTQMD
eukprot:GHVT01100327.1.p1 GENE.GHVT01100327.1~~GHVT01100327.1.p1  ORF type:complete len:1296 (+),score=151.84 GHVT01100327.1:3163-7050(+)